MSPAPLRRILVIDDVPDNVAVLFDFLRTHGFKILVSESGSHALGELPAIAPDLILLDVMMPGLDGFETCRRLKADPKFSDVPVFFMTALGDPVDKVRGFQLGAADYITKPIFPEEVLARIRVHLELRDRNRELAEQNEKLDAAIQQRVAAERALRASLDRAVLVIGPDARPQFVSDAAAKLLQRFFPSHTGPSLPGAVANQLSQSPTAFTVAHGNRDLVFTPAPRNDAKSSSTLIYLEEKAPPPSPEMLHVLGLTPREAEILFWVAQGKTSPEIAIIVGNAPATVKKHVENITAKLGVETRLAAALKAMEILGPM
jgi:Response regulator containing a CheY-like receiver domain and an HD-GYP domain